MSALDPNRADLEAHRQQLAVLAPLARELSRLEPAILEALAALDPHSMPTRPPEPAWRRWLSSVPAVRAWLAPGGPEPMSLEQRLEVLQRHRQALLRLEDRLLIERARAGGHPEIDELRQELDRSVAALTEVLEESLTVLDASLADMAAREAHAHARRVVGPVAEALHAKVVRVRRLNSEGARVTLAELDRLAVEVALLAPVDAAGEAAEAELASFLRDRTVADAVRRARGEES